MSVHSSFLPAVSAAGRRLVVPVVCASWCAVAATAHETHHHDAWSSARPDGHAPIGVMGDHTHGAGEWMLAYRFMSMHMEDFRDGTDEVTADDILMPNGPYMMAPTEMTMQMHMLGAMYAASDELTLMVMGNYLDNEMTVRRRMPMMGIDETFETSSSGLGDTAISGLYRLAAPAQRQSIHLNLGIGLPTGSIDETDDTPMGDDTHLPHPMQLGSGTWDLLPGITWLGQAAKWSWGAQASAIVRLGENDQGYTLGNRYTATAWGAWRVNDWVSGSLRLQGASWDAIDGRDEDLPDNAAMMNPNADPDLRGGERLQVGLGLNVAAPGGHTLGGHRLAVEYLVPVYEDLDGPQMALQQKLIVGWQFAF